MRKKKKAKTAKSLWYYMPPPKETWMSCPECGKQIYVRLEKVKERVASGIISVTTKCSKTAKRKKA